MSRVIGVFSGKGGVGKTTLVANLGATLTNGQHKNVVIFDNNVHSSHLGLHLGLYEDLPVTLREVLKNHVPILQSVYIHPTTGMRIIPAPLNGADLDITKDKCCILVNQVKKNYDVVILDCAPGLGKEVVVPMQAIDDAIVISTPDIASVTDAMKTIELLKKFKKNILGIVVNRYRKQKYELAPEEISSATNYNVIGIIPEDYKIPDSISKGLPAVISYPHSSASTAIKRLAAYLMNEPYKEVGIWEKIKNVFSLNKTTPSSRTEVKPIDDNYMMKKDIPKKEVSDLTDIKEELMGDAKEELKREIMYKVRKRLKERMNES